MNKQIEKILYYKKWKEKEKRHLILKFDTRFDTNFCTKGVQNGMEMVRERENIGNIRNGTGMVWMPRNFALMPYTLD